MANAGQYTPTDSSGVTEKVTPYVQIKTNWSSSWQTLNYIWPMQIMRGVSPALGQAILGYAYGQIKQQADSSFRTYSPQDLDGCFVRVVARQEGREAELFVGIIVDIDYKMLGADNGVAGDQTFIAYSLDYLLDRLSVVGAFVESASTIGGVNRELAYAFIDSTPEFNRRNSTLHEIVGNRSLSAGANGAYLFSSNTSTWSNLDVLNYIVTWFAPSNVVWRITGQYQLLDSITTVHKLEGMTLKQALDHLIDRHRGLGWSIRVSGGVANIHIHSVFDQPVRIDETTVYPANPEQFTIPLDGHVDIGEAVVRLMHSARYDTVVVSGERIETAVSLALGESGGLVPGWTPTDETAYLTLSGSGDLGDADKNDEARRADKYEHVYQLFRIRDDWDGLGLGVAEPDPLGGEPQVVAYNALPSWTANELDTVTPSILYPNDKVLLRHLPILKDGIDEYREPIAFIADPDDATKYIQLDTPEGEDRPSASLRMADDRLGFFVKSRVNHIMAKGHWDSNTIDSNVEPAYDYTTLIATLCIPTDERLRIVRDCEGADPARQRVLYIDVDGAKLQYCTANTAIGVDPLTGGLEYHYPGVIRDDSKSLREIAGLASAWYGRERASISLTINQCVLPVLPGQMISSISSGWHREPVNTVVSSVVWTFSHDRMSTRIETAYFEIDASRFIEFPSIGNTRALAREVRRLNREVEVVATRTRNIVDRQPRTTSGGGVTGQAVLLIPLHAHVDIYSGGTIAMQSLHGGS